MDTFRSFKKDLIAINQDLTSLLSTGSTIPGIPDRTFDNWISICSTLHQQISEEVLRIAVVGAIKSGKSTFLNALFEGEYFKRGAGVVTSIVTRVRGGSQPKAKLLFKSLDEINQDIKEAIALLPFGNPDFDREKFDIRQNRQRKILKATLKNLSPEQLITQGTRNLNSVLLHCYLNGYEPLKEMLSAKGFKKEFESAQFRRHWDFVGDDSLSIFLKDIHLEIDSKNLANDTEFADCQGSDSPNPLHLVMIQDYLQLSHLIIYLVSSRTGLREADIKFLSTIRKMGILDNVLFVVNCDLSEHESLEDLKFVIAKVTEELQLIKSNPEVFAYSALFDLFKSIKEDLPEKDLLRLAQWESQSDIAEFSNRESTRFKSDLAHHLIRKRSRLLLKNQIERHGVILSGMANWISINRELFSRNEQEAGKIIESITHQQKRMDQIKTMVETTAAGAVPKIKAELNNDSNQFFDNRSGECVGNVIEFIRDYRVESKKYEESLINAGFLNTVYLVFQEFKRSLDRAMADSVYPEVVQFVFEEEKKIEKYFQSIFEPYEAIVDGALVDLDSAMRENDIVNSIAVNQRRADLPAMDSLKEISKLRLPPLVAFLRYSAKIKTDAFMKLGFYSFMKGVRRILKKQNPPDKGTYARALQGSVKRMKQLTEKSIIYQCKDYRENLKFKYLYKLVDIVAQKLTETLLDRFQTYGTSTAAMIEQINRNQTDRQRVASIIRKMETLTTGVNERISHLRDQIEGLDS